jgi:hypothetical protein
MRGIAELVLPGLRIVTELDMEGVGGGKGSSCTVRTGGRMGRARERWGELTVGLVLVLATGLVFASEFWSELFRRGGLTVVACVAEDKDEDEAEANGMEVTSDIAMDVVRGGGGDFGFKAGLRYFVVGLSVSLLILFLGRRGWRSWSNLVLLEVEGVSGVSGVTGVVGVAGNSGRCLTATALGMELTLVSPKGLTGDFGFATGTLIMGTLPILEGRGGTGGISSLPVGRKLFLNSEKSLSPNVDAEGMGSPKNSLSRRSLFR